MNQEEEVNLENTSEDSSSEVKFDEDSGDISYGFEGSRILQLVIKYSGGLIKDKTQAQYVVLGFVAIIIFISLIFFFNRNRPLSPPSADEIIEVAGPEDKTNFGF